VPPVDVSVNLPTILRAYAEGRAEVTVEAETLSGALEALFAKHPLLRVHLYGDNGALREHVLIFYNDQNSRWLDSTDVRLKPGDSITVLQAVSGG
jgi:adenylyltransferase/sulfurtransferase